MRISDIKLYAKTAENIIRMDITFFCLCCFPEDILPHCPNYATLTGRREEMKRAYENEYQDMVATIKKEISFQNQNIKTDYDSDIVEITAESDGDSHDERQPLEDDLISSGSESDSDSESEEIDLERLDGFTPQDTSLIRELQQKVEQFKRGSPRTGDDLPISRSEQEQIERRHSIICPHGRAVSPHRKIILKDR